MSDPPLHTLCRICHSRPPLYTCPRCRLRTCSLTCAQTHKRRASCSGIRDPTVYKPMRQLATPAGIDHDYNFLSAIERGVERSDRVIVEERGLVGRRELVMGPREEGGRDGGEGEQRIRREMGRMGVRVERLPRGMARRRANGTSWSRKLKCVVWQVEWVRETGQAGEGKQTESREGLDTTHSKILTTTPLGEAYAALLEEQRRAALTPEERAREKKRRALEVAEREAKRARVGAAAEGGEGRSSQDRDEAEKPDVEAGARGTDITTVEVSKSSDYNFYLHRPHTPSNLPTVLIPLRPDLPLDTQLQGKVIVEYPTIYVFRASSGLPGGFMLQDDFFKRKGIGKVGRRGVEEGEIDSGSESDEEDEGGSEGEDGVGMGDGGEVESETSSSGTSEEESGEEEEEGSERSQEFDGLDHTP